MFSSSSYLALRHTRHHASEMNTTPVTLLVNVYPPTKLEVSISTHLEDKIKGDTKCRKWGGLKCKPPHFRHFVLFFKL